MIESLFQILLDISLIEQLWSRGDASTDYRLAIFDELVCQRLLKGFQIVLMPKHFVHSAISSVNSVEKAPFIFICR